MLSHEEWVNLIEDTVAVLQVDLAALTPQTGKGIVDAWVTAVGAGANTTDLVNTLEGLKTQLESNTNAEDVQTILQQLADQTADFSTLLGAEGDMSTRVDALASALRVFGGQLGNG